MMMTTEDEDPEDEDKGLSVCVFLNVNCKTQSTILDDFRIRYPFSSKVYPERGGQRVSQSPHPP
jgi:hypothetical protein